MARATIILMAGVSALACIASGAAAAQTTQQVPPPAGAAAPATPVPGDSASDAQAQVAGEASPSAPASAAATQDIVVTGSRLGASGFSAPTPVTVLGQGKLETRAPGSIADVVNELPAFRQTSGPTQSQRLSAGTGQNNLDLRGLGISRTLMLINGQRQSTTDTNVIPVGLVDRVEVVTGGASAAYGSDAVAGVVNFVLKKKIEGIQMTAQGGISNNGDDGQRLLTVAAGTSFADNRGHIIAGLDFSDNDGVGTIYNRNWGREQAGLVSFGSAATRGTLPAQGFLPNVTYSAQTAGSVITSGALKNTAFGQNGVPYTLQQGSVYSNVMSGGDNYGQNPSGNFPISVPIKRLATLARAEFELTDSISVFAEGAYADVESHGYTSFYQAPSIIVSINNPYLPAATRTAAIAAGIDPTLGTLTLGRTITEQGGYQLPADRKTYRGVVGASGKLFGDWTWDAAFQYAKTHSEVSNATDVLPANLLQAAYAVRDTSGNIVCGPVASNPNLTAALRAQLTRFQSLSNATCQPFNIFGQGSPSAAALGYVSGGGLTNLAVSNDELKVVSANIKGSPFATWAGPVQLAFGGEYREQSTVNTADPLSLSQTWASSNAANYSGKLNVKEGYVELGVPLAKNSVIGRSLDLNGAARYTDYSTSGSVWTWKVGLTYEPFQALRFRVTRSRDIRAPNLTELYQTGATVPVANIVNPLNNQTGVINTIVAGNPNLVAEKADTWTGGVVFQPTGFASGLRMSVDYYSIKVNGVIASLTAPEILRRCAAGDTTYCSAVVFDGSAFGISAVQLKPFNLNQLQTSGLDIELSYRVPMSQIGLPGSLNLRGLATHVFNLKTTDSTGTIDRAGSLQQNGVPAWTANVDLTYEVGGFSGTLGTRFFSSSLYDATLIGPDNAAYNPQLANSINNNVMPSRTYFDLSLRYDIPTEGRRKLQVFTVISNLLDKDPPYNAILINSGGNPYDLIGRTYKVGVRVGF